MKGGRGMRTSCWSNCSAKPMLHTALRATSAPLSQHTQGYFTREIITVLSSLRWTTTDADFYALPVSHLSILLQLGHEPLLRDRCVALSSGSYYLSCVAGNFADQHPHVSRSAPLIYRMFYSGFTVNTKLPSRYPYA